MKHQNHLWALLVLLPFFLLNNTVFAQKEAPTEKEVIQKKKPLYHPEENAAEKIAELVKKAQKENKNIVLQGGGNWCIWCWRFDAYWKEDPELKKLVHENYLYYHLNWSPENKNEAIFAQYDFPGKKYGYPVLIILDKNGELLHIQNSAVLEEGKSYNKSKVKAFFNQWKPEV